MELNLTDEEATILDNYIFRKCCKLKDSGLDDAKCYVVLNAIHAKITDAINRNKLDELRKKLEGFYNEGVKDPRIEGLEGVTKVEFYTNYDEMRVEVILYEDNDVVGEWAFKNSGDDVICVDDNTIANMSSYSEFFSAW